MHSSYSHRNQNDKWSVSPFTQATSYARTEYLGHHRVWLMQKPTDQNKDGFTNQGQGQEKKK